MKDNWPQTLVELLKRAVSAHPEREALRFKKSKEWVAITAEQLFERVRNVALGLYDQGIRKGDRIAILAESGPLWSITDYAVLANGAVNVPIYPTQPPHQVEYILRESEPKLLFVSGARQMRRVSAVLERFPDLRIVPFQPIDNGENILSFAALEEAGAALNAERPELFDLLTSDVHADDMASIIYTSGTKGEPKGAILTHGNITFNAMASGVHLDIEPGGVMLSFLPLSHIFERMVLYLCLYFQVQINYANGIETVATDIQEVHPTLMSTVPRLLEKIYARMQKNAGDGSRLQKKIFDRALVVARRAAQLATMNKAMPPLLELQREIADKLVFEKLRSAVGGRIIRMVSGGAALPSDIAFVFIGAGVPVLQGYGLTETSPVIAACTLDHNRIGSVGRPIPGIELKIAEDGEILTRGPHVFQGYFNKPEETAAAFAADPAGGEHWFKTGDIGVFDPDGFLFITDRKKDLIKTSAGKYVAPQMIEGFTNQSEYIEQTIIVGDKRKYVSALIVPDFERLRVWAKSEGIKTSDKHELAADRKVIDMIKADVNRLTSTLADYEKVKRIALLSDEFSIDGGELTPTLKIKRRVVEDKYRDLIESLYSGSE